MPHDARSKFGDAGTGDFLALESRTLFYEPAEELVEEKLTDA
jgi:hypothetical protein